MLDVVAWLCVLDGNSPPKLCFLRDTLVVLKLIFENFDEVL